VTAYGDSAYRVARELLRVEVVACVHRGPRCTGRATSPDHVPALAEHAHVAGSGCCVLVPSCRACNYGRGAALVNRRRRRAAPARLVPGSGTL